MTFESTRLFALLAATAAAWTLLPPERTRLRIAVLAIASPLALWWWLGLPVEVIAMLGAAVAWISLGLVATRSLALRSSMIASLLVFAPLLVWWVIGKQLIAMGEHPIDLLYFVGFSYFLVKAWTLIRDVHEGVLARPDPIVMIAYFTFFPTYISGPMHQLREFQAALDKPLALDGEAVVGVVFRILVGLLKIQLIAAVFHPMSLTALVDADRVTLSQLVRGAFAYSVVIWADFSGYSDLAIATSRLIGVATPENFNRPYLAPNIREFWQRWHISFSRTLTSYVFVPVSRALGRLFGARRKLVMVVAYLVTFLICGYWHGPTTNFLAWGGFHAVGLIVFDLYRSGKKPKRGVKPSRLGRSLAIAGTFIFISLGWILFVLPLSLLGTVR